MERGSQAQNCQAGLARIQHLAAADNSSARERLECLWREFPKSPDENTCSDQIAGIVSEAALESQDFDELVLQEQFSCLKGGRNEGKDGRKKKKK